MAYRLSEAGASVLVIEHGGTDAGPFIQMPAALSYPMNMARYDWGYRSEPETASEQSPLACPRGKVIGGSILDQRHGLCARSRARLSTHGPRWAQMAGPMPTCCPTTSAWKPGTMVVMAAIRPGAGKDGPLHVSRGPRENPLFQAFVDAGQQAGYEVTGDYNGEKQEGFGPMEQTVWKGRRWSAANAYLKPALKRDNCDIVRGLASRVVMENGRATGVELIRGGKKEIIRARREVVLAASSINSPKLLMLSGIGPAAHLAEHGVEVVADRPGVGANLQDHLELYIQQASLQPITLYKHWNLVSKGLIGAQWLFTKDRPGGVEPVRKRGLHPLEPGCRVSGYPVPFSAHCCSL